MYVLKKYKLIVALAIFFIGAFFSSAADGGMSASYLYSLSNFNGPVPYDRPRIFADRDTNDIYVLYTNSIRIFNETGMEVYTVSFDVGSTYIVDLAVNEEGDILALAYKGQAYSVLRCNFRGEPRETLEIKSLPQKFLPFSPNRLVYRQGKLYFADTTSLKIAVTDAAGKFITGYDLVPLLDLKEKDRPDTSLGGFNVDRDGNMLFTVPVLFSAHRLTPDGTIASFGQRGSVPGKFNIVAGITTDRRGNYLVVDVLKCAIIVFDRNFNFLMQFGSRGLKPGQLIAPQDMFIDGSDRVYVTQARQRGVSVFRLVYD